LVREFEATDSQRRSSRPSSRGNANPGKHSPVESALDGALVSLRARSTGIAVGDRSADAADMGVPRLVNLPGLKLDFDDLAAVGVNAGTDDETLLATVDAMVYGDDVTGQDLVRVAVRCLDCRHGAGGGGSFEDGPYITSRLDRHP